MVLAEASAPPGPKCVCAVFCEVVEWWRGWCDGGVGVVDVAAWRWGGGELRWS